MIEAAICELRPLIGVRAACAAVGEPQARYYRRHRKSEPPPREERVAAPQPRALSEVERKELRRVLNSEEHQDEAPATVYAKLLDEGVYLGSISTMYRVLREHTEVGDRRRHATHPAHKKPELLAAAPNRVWSWDITKLHGPQPGSGTPTQPTPTGTCPRPASSWPWPPNDSNPRLRSPKENGHDRPGHQLADLLHHLRRQAT